MKYTFRNHEPYQSAYYEHMRIVARECLLWRMTLAEHDALTQVEYAAWVSAWNELQQEGK